MNVTRKFPKTDLQELTWGDAPDGYEIISDEIDDHGRWTVSHTMIFKFEDKFYETGYRTGATEMQDERPYEFDDDEVDCIELVPVEKTITVYEPKTF